MISATPLSVSGLMECTAQYLTNGTISSGLSGVSIIPWGHGARSYLLIELYLIEHTYTWLYVFLYVCPSVSLCYPSWIDLFLQFGF